MVFKLVESAQVRWRAITAPHLVALVRIGALIACGHLAPAENSAGRAGVTITGGQAERTWRDSATYRAKSVCLLKDTNGFFSPLSPQVLTITP
jgi:hypothetical protein